MQTLDPINPTTSPAPSSESDLDAAIRRVLESSPEPLTLSKIRASLPTKMRTISLDELGDSLRRQVAANVVLQYPKYRSPQDRFWDRPMRDHIVYLLKTVLAEKAMPLSELRRKLPDYAKDKAEEVLTEEVTQGNLHSHPPASVRSGPRFGVEPPSAKTYLKDELTALFARLEKLGFTQAQLRQGALELLHEEEWSPAPPLSTPDLSIPEGGSPLMPAPEPTLYAANEPTRSMDPMNDDNRPL